MTITDGSAHIAGGHAFSSVTAKIAAIVWAVGNGRGSSLTDVAQRTGLPRSTAHRLLGELVRGQLLERDAAGEYRTCPALHRYGRLSEHRRAVELRAQVCTVLDDLGITAGRRARFGIWRGADIAYLERPAGAGAYVAGVVQLPTHATALGQMLLAHVPPTLSGHVLGRGLPGRTTLPGTALQHLEWSLAAARRNGLAVTRGGRGLCAAAVPVRGPDGTVVGALELTVDTRTHELAPARAGLLMAARALARELAGRPEVLPTGTGDRPFDWRTDPTGSPPSGIERWEATS